MQIYKYISAKAVIEDVYRSNGYQYDLPWLDMIEWVFEALMLIGHPSQYITKICGSEGNSALDITDHKAKLPNNFYKLLWILVNGYPATLQQGGSMYLIDNDCCELSSNISMGETWTDNAGNVFDNGLGMKDWASIQPVTYDINDNYLTLSTKEGKVCMGYLAYPVDCDGFPEIPDHIKCKLAVSKYLTKKLDYIEWRKGNLPREVFEHSDKECNWYMASMANQLKQPDLAEMANMKNQVIRSFPRINEERTLFQFLGSPENRRF